jgi:hypothetical protein
MESAIAYFAPSASNILHLISGVVMFINYNFLYIFLTWGVGVGHFFAFAAHFYHFLGMS